MKFSIPSIIALALVSAASAAVVQRVDDSKSDWKYAVGWDGTTLPADAIGTPEITNSTSTAHLEKRTVGGVYICAEILFSGRCGYAVQPLNTCINLGSDWADQISSFGPDKCTHCTAYGPRGCSVPAGSNQKWTFDNPGDEFGGLQTTNPWNDKIGSFICTQSC